MHVGKGTQTPKASTPNSNWKIPKFRARRLCAASADEAGPSLSRQLAYLTLRVQCAWGESRVDWWVEGLRSRVEGV